MPGMTKAKGNRWTKSTRSEEVQQVSTPPIGERKALRTLKPATERVFRGSEDHLVLYVGIIRRPATSEHFSHHPMSYPYLRANQRDSPLHKSQFVPNPFSPWQRVLEIIHRPSTFLLRQFSDKLVKVLVIRSLEDDDGAPVFGEAVNDVG